MSETTYSAPQESGLRKDSVIRLATQIAKQLHYAPGAELDRIVERLGGKLEYQNFWELEETSSGSIKIDGENNFTIYLAAHTGQLRDRFTIAHELGHYILHYLYPIKQGRDPGPIKAQRYGSGRVEWEANWFAAGFLMPEEEFRSSLQKYGNDLIEVADEFGVSISAAEVRARSLGIET